MTENKRFTYVRKKNPILNEMENYIEDNGNTILKITMYSDCEDIVDLLNNLNDENEQLKQQLRIIIDTAERNGVITKSELKDIKKELQEWLK